LPSDNIVNTAKFQAAGDLAASGKRAWTGQDTANLNNVASNLGREQGDIYRASAAASLATGASGIVDGALDVENPGVFSDYKDIRESRSNVPNRGTNVSMAEFEKNLIENGWQKRISKDGVSIILEKDGAKYTIRAISNSTQGPTAEYFPPGSSKFTLKIRLDGIYPNK